jgi:hypothetical protein
MGSLLGDENEEEISNREAPANEPQLYFCFEVMVDCASSATAPTTVSRPSIKWALRAAMGAPTRRH